MTRPPNRLDLWALLVWTAVVGFCFLGWGMLVFLMANADLTLGVGQ